MTFPNLFNPEATPTKIQKHLQISKKKTALQKICWEDLDLHTYVNVQSRYKTVTSLSCKRLEPEIKKKHCSKPTQKNNKWIALPTPPPRECYTQALLY